MHPRGPTFFFVHLGAPSRGGWGRVWGRRRGEGVGGSESCFLDFSVPIMFPMVRLRILSTCSPSSHVFPCSHVSMKRGGGLCGKLQFNPNSKNKKVVQITSFSFSVVDKLPCKSSWTSSPPLGSKGGLPTVKSNLFLKNLTYFLNPNLVVTWMVLM